MPGLHSATRRPLAVEQYLRFALWCLTSLSWMSGRLTKIRWAGRITAGLIALVALAPGATAAVPAHGRAWELVTPGPTNGVNLFGARAWASDGDRLVFLSLGPMPGAPSGDLLAHNLGIRTATGWKTQPIGVPLEIPTPDFTGSQPLAVDADIASWLWSSTQPLLAGAPSAPNLGLYRRGPDDALSLLGDVGDSGAFGFGGASSDVEHAVFQTTAHLLPADAGRTSGGDAYEFAGPELRLVGVDSAGSPISPCGSGIGNGSPGDSLLQHPLSRNGQRVFFSAPASPDCGLPTDVYLREDGTQTTRISASRCQRADCSPPQGVTFAGATPDGSVAFLATNSQLTDDDVDNGTDLYRYDVASDTLTRVSAGASAGGPGVIGTLVRSAEDGSRVYFLTSDALIPGAGEQGRSNLYLSDHGELRFVAVDDDFNFRNSAISSDGATLVFATHTSLLPGDADASVDVYHYDVVAGGLTLISQGMGDRGNGAFDTSFGDRETFRTLDGDEMRVMSADGQRVFFVTSEALVPDDVNETSDVYEWTGNTLGLVSSGAGDDTVQFAGASADGRSVFFATDATLMATDRNGGDQDLYVARLGGGFPPPPAVAPPCEGDACQGAPGPRLQGLVPDTLVARPATRRLRMLAPGGRALARLAAGRHAWFMIEVPGPGQISLVARARVAHHVQVAARSQATVDVPGRARLRLQLSRAARRTLTRRGALELTLSARHSRFGRAPSVAVGLRRAA